MKITKLLQNASFLVAAAGLAALVPAGSPSLAQPESATADAAVVLDQSEAVAKDAEIYAATYNVSFDEAVRRMLLMHQDAAEILAVEGEDGADFAGSYFDNQSSEFGLVVRTKKAQKQARKLTRKADQQATKLLDKTLRAQRREQRKAARALVKLSNEKVERAEDIMASDLSAPVKYKTSVAFSLAELEADLAGTLAALKAVKGFQVAYVDEKQGQIVILVDDSSTDAATKVARQGLKAPFRVELRPGGFKGVAFRGGQVPSTPSYPRYCMTAFGARHNSAVTSTGAAQTGVVTARHCDTSEIISLKDPANGVVYPMIKGAFFDDRGSGASRADLRFLYHGTRVASSQFYFDSSGAVRTVTGTRSRSSTTVRNGATNGSFICHLGQASLGSATYVQSCGEVISTTTAQNFNTSGDLTWATTGGYFVMVQNTQSGAGTAYSSGAGTLKCYQGDSGGPWFANTIAYGVMSSCSWHGAANTIAAESVFTSTDYFSQLGVTILVN
ncbi:MAG TPA: hypothetical protein VGB04_13800 [Allosphingosinicella sp.]